MCITRCWRYCISDSLLGAVSICISFKGFLCCEKPPLMGISVTIPLSYTGSKYQYSNHRKHKVLDKLNLTDVYNFVLNADLTKIFCFCICSSLEWWLFACCSHYFFLYLTLPCHLLYFCILVVIVHLFCT